MAIGDMVPREDTIVEPETGERPVIKVEPPQDVYETQKTIIKEKRIIWYVWFVIEMLLLFRFLIKVFGANPDSVFSILVDVLTFPFTFLFIGLFSPTIFDNGGNSIEWSTLFAMFAYVIVALVAARFFRIMKPIDPKEAKEKS